MGKERLDMVVEMKIFYNKLCNSLGLFKKIAFLSLLISILVLIISCDYQVSLYNTNVRDGIKVVNVDLIRYNSPNDILTDEMETFSSDYLETIARLSNDNLTEFLDKLAEISVISSKPKNNIKAPSGLGVLLTYEDNGFTIITSATLDENNVMYIGDFSSNSTLEYFESFIWNEGAVLFDNLVFEYFDYSL